MLVVSSGSPQDHFPDDGLDHWVGGSRAVALVWKEEVNKLQRDDHLTDQFVVTTSPVQILVLLGRLGSSSWYKCMEDQVLRPEKCYSPTSTPSPSGIWTPVKPMALAQM